MNKLRFSAAALFFVSLAQAQTPVVNAGGIVNTGNYSSGGVAPGSIVSIFGTNLANQLQLAGSVPLPTSLANVRSVTFNGVTAGLYFVSSNQINAEVPWNVLSVGSSGSANVVVTTSGGASSAQTVQIVPAMPGIFTTTANGLGQAIATSNADGGVSAAALSIPGLAAHPIQIGAYLVIWCTGLGSVDISVPNGGNTGGQIANTLLQPTVLIGGVAATPVYSVLSPQFAGEYQIGVQVAAGTPTGTAIPVQIQINGVTTSNNVTIAVEPGYAQPMTSACTLVSSGCTQITVNGDPAAVTGVFAGYADISIRQDPLTGTLWMGYSYLHTISSGVQGIDTHIASSTDGGRSWNYQGDLYPAAPQSNPVTGLMDYTHNEVINLLPQVINGVTYWYGIHSYYYVPQTGAGGGSAAESYSKRWEIAMAPDTTGIGPMALASAGPQFLGQAINTDGTAFPVSVDLTTIDPELSGCSEFFEPALVMSGNNLYLFLSCTGLPVSQMFYAVFRTTDPQDHAGNWNWTYIEEGVNKFATLSDAQSIGGHMGGGTTYLTQMDIAPSKTPGVLLAIVTAAYNTPGGKVSLGCAAAEMASVDPPRFVYNDQGQVQVDAVITSPDSTTDGPGSCTYSPFSSTGLIMSHRQTSHAPQNGAFYSFPMQSLLFP